MFCRLPGSPVKLEALLSQAYLEHTLPNLKIKSIGLTKGKISSKIFIQLKSSMIILALNSSDYFPIPPEEFCSVR